LASGFDLFFATSGFGDPDGANIPTNMLGIATNTLAAFVAADTSGTNAATVTWKSLPSLTALYGHAWVPSARTFRAALFCTIKAEAARHLLYEECHPEVIRVGWAVRGRLCCGRRHPAF